MKTREWRAWYNRMPGAKDPLLRVSGVCELPSSSVGVSLEYVPDGVLDEPELLTLRLVSEAPEFGDAMTTERRVAWEGEYGPDITQVRIRIPDEATKSIAVTIAH